MRRLFIAFLTMFLVGGHHIAAKGNDTSSLLQPLSTEDRIEGGGVIGGYRGSETPVLSTFLLPSREGLLIGIELMISSIEGEKLTDPELSQQISDELGEIFGGWFTQDLTPYIQLHETLVSEGMKKITRAWEETETAFYYLDFAVPPWKVQVVGELGVFHAVSIGHALSEAEALQRGGLPVRYPLGPIEPVLAEATPKLPLQELSDRTSEHGSNVFDIYLQSSELTVKSGVRWSVLDEETETVNQHPYHYGIRINLDLRSSE